MAAKRNKGRNFTADIQLIGMPYHFAVRFKDTGKLRSFDLLSVFQQEPIRWGVLMLGVRNFCLAHTEKDIAETLEAYSKAFQSRSKKLSTLIPYRGF